MTRDDWPVGDKAIRTAGDPDTCFYCSARRGYQHATGCVMRQRTVVVEATVRYVIDVPEDWDAHDIEVHRNESSWCVDNALDELAELSNRVGCLCNHVVYRYIGEATELDEDRDEFRVRELPA